jgi:spore germination protein YaaH
MKIRRDTRLFNVPARLRSAAAVSVLALVAACGVPSREEVGFPVLGYYAWWMGRPVEVDLSLIDTVFFFDLSVDSAGAIADARGWPGEWSALTARAEAARTRVVPVVTLLDEASFSALFANPAAVDRLGQVLLGLALDPAAEGVHVDFEVFSSTPAGTRQAFSAFFSSLAGRIRTAKPGAAVSIFLPAFDRPEVFDEAALAAAADYVVVQGYDLHWKDGPRAGPIAPLRGWGGVNWEAILARYDALGIPREKLYFSVPYYGFEWPTESDRPGAATRGAARMVTYAPFDSLMPADFAIAASSRIRETGHRRDSLSGAPYYAFEAEDGWYQGWFEDEESLRQKYAFIRRERMGGVALFALGYDQGEMEEALWVR